MPAARNGGHHPTWPFLHSFAVTMSEEPSTPEICDRPLLQVSFDYFLGLDEDRLRHDQAEGLGSLEIDR